MIGHILTNTPLKITGVGTLSTYEKVTASQHVEREGFDGRPGRPGRGKRGGGPDGQNATDLAAG